LNDRFGQQLAEKKGTIFRDDIDPAKTWVISDTHFGHRNIVDFANRPPDHESLLLERWAANVGESDTLLHLGDLVYRGNAQFRALIAPHLTGGRKLLVKGNHDHQRPSFYKKCGFKFARPFSIKWGHWNVSFSHYPWSEQEEGRPMGDNDFRLHGHIHTSGYTRASYVPFLKNHINLSCEQTNYQPVNLALLLSAALDGNYPEANGAVTEKELSASEIGKESHHA
jgi:calcineurin-like phosphoesterase family protein